MKDRILQIMKTAGLSNADFAEKIGISTSSLSHIFSGRNNPSLDVVMRIHKAYPDVNLNWLLYGEGEMGIGAETPDPAPDDGDASVPTITGFGIFDNTAENAEFADKVSGVPDFRKENAPGTAILGTKTVEKEVVKYIEKPQPKITEIRIFFDNGTYQVFKPDN